MSSIRRNKAGTTLIELVVAMVILAVAAIGALSYEYHASSHYRIAQREMIATRTAQMVLEDWKSSGGSSDYDPRNLGVGFERSNTDSDLYLIEVDELPIQVRVFWRDIDNDPVASVTLREIGIIVRWRSDFSSNSPGASDPRMTLSTYVRLDAAGG